LVQEIDRVYILRTGEVTMADDQEEPESKFKTFEASLTTKDVGAIVPVDYQGGDD